MIDCVKGSCHLVSYGTIETKPDFSHQNRLLIIFKKLQEIIKEFRHWCRSLGLSERIYQRKGYRENKRACIYFYK